MTRPAPRTAKAIAANLCTNAGRKARPRTRPTRMAMPVATHEIRGLPRRRSFGPLAFPRLTPPYEAALARGPSLKSGVAGDEQRAALVALGQEREGDLALIERPRNWSCASGAAGLISGLIRNGRATASSFGGRANSDVYPSCCANSVLVETGGSWTERLDPMGRAPARARDRGRRAFYSRLRPAPARPAGRRTAPSRLPARPRAWRAKCRLRRPRPRRRRRCGKSPCRREPAKGRTW
jgi:hypothetical protein